MIPSSPARSKPPGAWAIGLDADGLPHPHPASVRRGRVEGQAPPRPNQTAGAGLGDQRIRHPDRRLPALRRKACGLLGGRRAHDLGDHCRTRGARGLLGLVDRANRFPEAGGVDAPVGDPRARVRLDAADVPVPADDRQRPLLAASRHRAPAPVARQGAPHKGDDEDDPRCRALRRRARRRIHPPALERRSRSRPGRRPAGPGDRRRSAGRAGAARPARQGVLSRGAHRGLWPDAPGLPVPGRELHRRLADRLRLHLVGRSGVEAEPPLPVRRLGDDLQHPLEPLAEGQGGALQQHGGPPTLQEGGVRGPYGHGDGVRPPVPAAGHAAEGRSGRWR